MPHLSNNLLHRLQSVLDLPDLGGTKYQLLEKFSRGGMGTIYLAEDTQLHRKVALKVMHLADATGEQAVRMLREAHVIAQLEHPGIVPVHDVGELPDGRVFYVMKFVHGRRLDQYSADHPPLPECLRVFQKICEALAFAHASGVIHRDLKPENVMVGAFGEVLVMDWGLAKILVEGEERMAKSEGRKTKGQEEEARRENCGTRIEKRNTANAVENLQHDHRDPEANNGGMIVPHETAHGTVMGTPAYMAPEQQRGEIDQIDQRTDVYALGAILKFLLGSEAGARAEGSAFREHRFPHAFFQASSFRAKTPKYLIAICGKAMAEEKAGRYAGACDLALDVERFLDGLAVSSYPENLFEKLWRIIKQYRFILLLICAYVLARLMLIFLLRR